MASNSNINNKVTFWNNYSFTNDVTKDNIPIIDTSKISKIDNNGIYFNNDLNVPHIMYNGYVFTAGSYVSGTSTNVTGNTYTIITSMSANTLGRVISYNYTTIDLTDIYRRLNYIEAELNRESKTDTLTLSPNSCSIYVGDTYNFNWQTETSKTPYFTGINMDNLVDNSYTINGFGIVTINNNNTISFSTTGLSPDNDEPITQNISLTSYSGIYNDINYISDSKTISITVNKYKQEDISFDNIPTDIYVGNDPQTINVSNIKDGAILNAIPEDGSILEVTVENNNVIKLKGLKRGDTNIIITIQSTSKYEKYERKISVSVKSEDTINYWYVGTVNPVNMTPPSVGDAPANLCEWTQITTSEISVYKTDESWEEHTWYIAIPEEYGYSIYDNGNTNITDISFTYTTSTIANVNYVIYETTFTMDTIDVKIK